MIKKLRPKHPDKYISSTNPEWTFTGRLRFRMPHSAENYLTSIDRDNTKCQNIVA